MLDMGFIPDIERIAKMIPFTRQTLFFSATMPPEIQKLADRFLQNPVRVEVAKPSSTAKTVAQRIVAAHNKDYEKRAVLRDLVRAEEAELKNAIIFCNRKKDVARPVPLARSSRLLRWRAAWRHGPAFAHDDAAEFQGRQSEAARRIRRCRPWPRYP